MRCVSYSPTIYNPPSFKCQDAVVSAEEAYLFCAEIAQQLNNLGFEKDRITYRWDHYVSSKYDAKEFDDISELTRPFYDELGRK